MATDSSKAGHRQRLRQKFIEAGLSGFLDYEIVELLLTLGTPRRDCKQMAKDAIKVFGSLANVLDATTQDLTKIKGIGPSNAFGIKLVGAVSEIYSKQKLEVSMRLDNQQKVYNYLRKKIGNKKKEHFVILCFNTRNKLIYEDVSIGTLNASLVHPREVFYNAIQNNASHIIVAHNHPSGDSSPSEEDNITTKRLIEAGKILGIRIIDHIIIGDNSYTSFKEKYPEVFSVNYDNSLSTT